MGAYQEIPAQRLILGTFVGNALLSRINALSVREKKLKDMILHGENVKRVQPLIDQMNAIHWKGKREKFRSAHQGEIDMYYISKRYLEQPHHVTEIMIPAWEKEQDRLRQEQEKLSVEYKTIRNTLNELLNVRYCVEYIMKKKEKEQNIQAVRDSMLR